MKKITYRKFDEQGYFKCERTSVKKYTVRGAMEHLQRNGFRPMFGNTRKLEYVWTNGRGINAYIG
jgi:hypothetical protein